MGAKTVFLLQHFHKKKSDGTGPIVFGLVLSGGFHRLGWGYRGGLGFRGLGFI